MKKSPAQGGAGCAGLCRALGIPIWVGSADTGVFCFASVCWDAGVITQDGWARILSCGGGGAFKVLRSKG